MITNLWSNASSEPWLRSMRETAESLSSLKSFNSSFALMWNNWGWFWRTPLRNFPTLVLGSRGVLRLRNSQWLCPKLAFTFMVLRLRTKQEFPTCFSVKNLNWGFNEEEDDEELNTGGCWRVTMVCFLEEKKKKNNVVVEYEVMVLESYTKLMKLVW